jgi:hypothetical protein
MFIAFRQVQVEVSSPSAGFPQDFPRTTRHANLVRMPNWDGKIWRTHRLAEARLTP